MVINGVTRNLGDSFTVTATDPYDDEKAQDAVAGMITNATHTGITWNYDDTTGTLAATVTGGGGGSSTLSGLTDTDLTTTVPQTGDVLTYDGTNWIPALSSTNTTGNFSGTFTGNVDAGVVTSDSFVKNGGTSSQYLMADGSVSNGPTIEMGGTMTASILPDTNAQYDLGSAEYKIRHLYLYRILSIMKVSISRLLNIMLDKEQDRQVTCFHFLRLKKY